VHNDVGPVKVSNTLLLDDSDEDSLERLVSDGQDVDLAEPVFNLSHFGEHHLSILWVSQIVFFLVYFVCVVDFGKGLNCDLVGCVLVMPCLCFQNLNSTIKLRVYLAEVDVSTFSW